MLIFCKVADGLAGACGGVLRGQGKPECETAHSNLLSLKLYLLGRQHLGALFNFVAYYIIALPLGIALAFLPQVHLGLQGLWIGRLFHGKSQLFV